MSGAALARIRRRLQEAGIESADLEAQLLVAHATGRTRAAAAAGDALPDEAQARLLEELLARRLDREPIPYLTGRAEFYGHSLVVGPGVLVPRPETETLVEEAARRIERRKGRATVADVGTGSGNVALALRRRFPEALVVAVELDADAIRFARRNLAGGAIVRGDLLGGFRAGAFDLVVSNPPYIARDEWASGDPELRHEPRIALDGGPDGLEIVRRLVRDARRALRPGGALLFEIGCLQGDFALGLLRASEYTETAVAPDEQGLPRVAGGSVL